MSVVDDVLRRYGLRWETNPCGIVVDRFPHLIVQEGPRFDLRESVLKGARERALGAARKRRERTTSPNVTVKVDLNRSIQGLSSVSGDIFSRNAHP